MTLDQVKDITELIDVQEFRDVAEPRMPDAYRDFVNNVGMEETLNNDLAAWRELHLRPRALTDVSNVDTSVELCGTTLTMPIITAPFIGSTLVEKDGEVATARGAVAAGSLSTLSMMGSRTPEEVGKAAPGRYWQQLYPVRDRSILKDIVDRAVDSGASALCFTVDLPVMPSFPARMKDASQRLRQRWAEPEHAMYTVRDYHDRSAEGAYSNAGATWSELEWLRGLSDLPLLLKGIIRPEDAILAREHGADGVVVSNHAGQGLRSSMPVAHALPYVVDAAQGSLAILVDSGIRTGVDVLRALALGAQAVLIGRPTLWGLTVGGAAGVERVLHILRDELAEVMAITGAARIADIDQAVLGLPR